VTLGGTSAYRAATGLPPLVQDAVSRAVAADFDHSCAPEQGRLLSLLAAGWRGGRIGETGTGFGVGLAWMVEATGADTSFVSIELDESRADACVELFAHRPNVTVLVGEWPDLRRHGPFDLLVLDGGGKGKDRDIDVPLDPTAGWLALGGTVVLDDFTPADTPDAPVHDYARGYWLEHPALRTTEIRLSPNLATLVGRRVA
jgi:predicted O-methyltransferase YrrM